MSTAPVAHHGMREIGRRALHIVAHSSSRSLVDQLRAALNALVEARSDVLAPQSHELDAHEVGRP